MNRIDPHGRETLVEYALVVAHQAIEATIYGTSMSKCLHAFAGETMLLNPETEGEAAQSNGLQIAAKLQQCAGEAGYDLARGFLATGASHL